MRFMQEAQHRLAAGERLRVQSECEAVSRAL
jgi:hypothetical protein